jgi:uncharacterized membrane protein
VSGVRSRVCAGAVGTGKTVDVPPEPSRPHGEPAPADGDDAREQHGAPPPPGAELPPPSIDDHAVRHGPDHPDDPDQPVIVGVSFDHPLRAQEYLVAMSRLRQDGALDLEDAVIVAKDANGKVKVTETVDPSPGRAALSGALWTGLLGLVLGGPVGWLAGLGVGAGAGVATAKVIDLGLPDAWVEWFEQAVRPGTSTIVILAENVDVHALVVEARRFPGAELLYTTLPHGVYEELAAAFGEGPRDDPD